MYLFSHPKKLSKALIYMMNQIIEGLLSGCETVIIGQVLCLMNKGECPKDGKNPRFWIDQSGKHPQGR